MRRGPLTIIAAALVPIALLAAPGASARAPGSFFGVSPQSTATDQDFARMGEAKVGTIRFGIHWAGVEPADGRFDWSGPDSIVRRAAENGIRPLPFLSGTPDWAAKLDGRNRCAQGNCAPYVPAGARARAAWSDFVGAAVARYGPEGSLWAENPTLPKVPIRTWQVWNEQNSPTFYKPRPDVKGYAKLLATSDDAIAAADPGATVVLGGMFGTPLGGRKPGLTSWDFLSELYDVKGAKRDFDGVAPHPYASSLKRVLSQIELMRDEIKSAQDRRATLWITELGWASGGVATPLNKGRRGQAAHLTEAFKYFVRRRTQMHIKAVAWYSWRDYNDPDAGLCEWCPRSGLLAEDYAAKPSLDAFTRFTGGS